MATEILRPIRASAPVAAWSGGGDWSRIAETVLDPAAGDGLAVTASADLLDSGREQRYHAPLPQQLDWSFSDSIVVKLRAQVEDPGGTLSVNLGWGGGNWQTPQVVAPGTSYGWHTVAFAVQQPRVLLADLSVSLVPTLATNDLLIDVLYWSISGATRLAGPRSGAVAGCRRLLAQSTAWQQQCGARTIDEAAARIYEGWFDDPDDSRLKLPYITLWADQHSSQATSRGPHNHFGQRRQTVTVCIYDNDRAGHESSASLRNFCEFLDALQDDVEALAGYDDWPDVMAVAEIVGPTHEDVRRSSSEPTGGYWVAVWELALGGGA